MSISPVQGTVSWRDLLAYSAPTLGFAFTLAFVQFYFLKFATDVLLLAPAVVGLLFGFGRIWDAISDPLVGYWSDRTRSRFGRRRPWMLAALPLLAFSFIILWSPSEGRSDGFLLLWSSVSLVLFYTAYTMYTVPHLALGAELTTNHHNRSVVFGSSRIAFVCGIMAAFAGIQFVTSAENPRAAISGFAATSMLAVVILLLAAPLFLREKRANFDRGARNPYSSFRDVSQNPHARRLLAGWFVESLGGGVLGVMAPYFTEYVLGRADLIAIVPAFFVLSGVVAVPLWIRLSRQFGKRNVWIVGMLGAAISFGAMFFVATGDVVLACTLVSAAGAFTACGGAIGPSILADVIDSDELQSGERKEGAYAAAWGFAQKFAIGIVIMLAGLALQAAGFQPNAVQTPIAERTLRGQFALVPFCGFLLGAWVLVGLKLTQAEYAEIRAELDRRAEDPQ